MHNILNWALNWEVDEKWDDGFWCILLQPQPATHFHGSEVLSCWGLRHHPPRPGRQVDWLSSPGLPCNNDVLVLHSAQNWHKSAGFQKTLKVLTLARFVIISHKSMKHVTVKGSDFECLTADPLGSVVLQQKRRERVGQTDGVHSWPNNMFSARLRSSISRKIPEFWI